MTTEPSRRSSREQLCVPNAQGDDVAELLAARGAASIICHLIRSSQPLVVDWGLAALLYMARALSDDDEGIKSIAEGVPRKSNVWQSNARKSTAWRRTSLPSATTRKMLWRRRDHTEIAAEITSRSPPRSHRDRREIVRWLHA